MNTVEFIKQICKDRNIPISKLERDCGFSNGYISGLKTGSIRSDRLIVIADYLNVAVNYLLNAGRSHVDVFVGDSTMTYISQEEKDLLDAFRKLNTEGRQRARQTLEDLCDISRYTEPTPEVSEKHFA